MRIAVCGSMVFSSDMIRIGKELEQLGHEVILPVDVEKCSSSDIEKVESESTDRKIRGDLIRGYFNKINNSNAILVYNKTKNGHEHYIGGNAFLEMGFAHALGKLIFLYNPIPEISYIDEIKAMQPIEINADLTRISLS